MKLYIKDIKPHPINSQIYINSNLEDLECSIQENGLLEPIVVNKSNVVISGHRRLQSCINLGLKQVDVRVKDFDDELIALVELNRYRSKTATELINEILILEDEYSKKIKRGRPKKGVSVSTFNGKVRDRISKLIGLSNSKIQRLKYIHNNWKDILSLIDDGKITINQGYTETKRRVVFQNVKVKSNQSSDNNPSNLETSSQFQIYNKSSLEMDDVDDNSIQTIMTSPPYYQQRDYGVEGQIGLEKSVDDYIENLMKVFRECKRVLSPQGSFFLNMGDKYIDGSLMSLPHQISIQMMKEGWQQRNCIIWRKSNPKPSSIVNRFHTSTEFIFFFTKSKNDYYFDDISVRQPYLNKDGFKDASPPRHHNVNGEFSVGTPVFQHPNGKIPKDYIDDVIETPKVSFGIGKELGIEDVEHIASYPPEICRIPILSTSREDDIVLDPFCGSGSTGEMSLKLGRKFIGYELNSNYCDLSKLRLQKSI